MPTGLTFAIGSHFFLNWTCNSFHELSVKWWNLLLLDDFLGIGVLQSHLLIYSCSSFQSHENTMDNQQNLKKKNRFFLGGFSAWSHQFFSCQTSAWCNCKKKQFTIFRAHVYLQTERWRSYTNTIPKTCYNCSKTAGFPLHLFENSSLEVSEKRRNSSNTSTGARPDGKVRFILGELFDTWIWEPNDRKWFWLDGIESCCVGVEGSSKSICVRRFSPSALSALFRFHLSPFPRETPDTQATIIPFQNTVL